MPLTLAASGSDTTWTVKFYPGEVPNDTGSAHTKFEVMSETSSTEKFRNLTAEVVE